VQWETTLTSLLEKGLTKSYEVGPGKVIAGARVCCSAVLRLGSRECGGYTRVLPAQAAMR
jgi:hypothetical protein